MSPESNTANREMIQVVGLGQACVDYRGVLFSYPQEDEKTELDELHMLCGGPAATAIVTLSRLNIPCTFLGSISDDNFGKKIFDYLAKENIDVSHLKITPGHTSQFAFIAVNKIDGKRTIFWHRGTCPHIQAREVDINQFPNARILHQDGLMVEASLAMAKQAQTKGITVVMDGGTMRDGTEELMSFVDILIVSETFATPLVGVAAPYEKVLKKLQSMGPDQVVITLGEKGSIGLDGQRIFRQKAFKVRAKDTTGAGDVYHGGYIYGVLQGWDMRQCMEFASAIAALKCNRLDVQATIPNLAAVNEFMQQYAYYR